VGLEEFRAAKPSREEQRHAAQLPPPGMIRASSVLRRVGSFLDSRRGRHATQVITTKGVET